MSEAWFEAALLLAFAILLGLLLAVAARFDRKRRSALSRAERQQEDDDEPL